MLMSFIGSVGTLMANTGLVELMNTAFGGVLKMLSGKKFPQNLRAMRMVVEDLLRSIVPAKKREGDWPLHLASVAAMMPYFFASSHFNYAR